MSFGMIFSIILIIIFISFAFYAIMKFLDIQKQVQVGKFQGDLQADVDKIWKGSQGSQEQEYFLPPGIDLVCFMNYLTDGSNKRGPNDGIYDELGIVHFGDENLFFFPVGAGKGQDSVEIKHLDLNAITQNENPYCIRNVKGKTRLTISKDFGENLVKIER